MTVAEIEKRADDIACMHGLQEDRHEIFATLAVAELKRREAEDEDAAHLAEMNEPTNVTIAEFHNEPLGRTHETPEETAAWEAMR